MSLEQKQYESLEIEDIKEISSTQREKMLQKSAKYLPDNPADSGMRASAVKPKFYGFVTDSSDSMMAYHNATIVKINEIFTKIISKLNDEFNGSYSKSKEIIDELETLKQGLIQEVDNREAKDIETLENANAYTYEKINQETIDRNEAIENAVSIERQALELEENTRIVSDNALEKKITDESSKTQSAIDDLEKRIKNIIGTEGNMTTLEGVYNLACQYAHELVSNLINNSPAALDTLKEIADALGNDPNFATTIINTINSKFNEAVGKIPSKVSALSNDSGYITGINKTMVVNALGYTPPTTDTNTTYSAGTGLNLSGTSFSVKYGTVAGTACQGNDSRLSNSRPASDVSAWAKASSKPSYTASEISGLANVAKTGNYNDLSNKPSMPHLYQYIYMLEGNSQDAPEVSPITITCFCDDNGYGGSIIDLINLLDGFFADEAINVSGFIESRPIVGAINETGGDIRLYYGSSSTVNTLYSLYDFVGIVNFTIIKIF